MEIKRFHLNYVDITYGRTAFSFVDFGFAIAPNFYGDVVFFIVFLCLSFLPCLQRFYKIAILHRVPCKDAPGLWSQRRHFEPTDPEMISVQAGRPARC